MGKNKYTELDKLFQSKLKSGQVENGAWNNPTDDAFMSAMRNIQPQEQAPKKEKIVWWPYLFLLFIPVFFFGIWNADRVSDLKSEIDVMQQTNHAQLDKATSEKLELENTTINNNNNVIELASNPVVNESDAKPVSKKPTTNKKTSKLVTNNNKFTTRQNVASKNIVPTSVNVTSGSDGGSIQNNGGQVSNASLGTNSFGAPIVGLQKNITDKLNTLDRLNLIQEFDDDFGVVSINDVSTYDSSHKYGSKPSLAAYAFVDLNLNSMRMQGAEVGAFTLTGYDKSYLGYNVGVGMLQNINKRWDVNYSLSYKHVKNQSKYTNQFMYEKDKMTTDINGELVYDLLAELHTPTGAFTSNQTIALMDGSMDDNVMMDQLADIDLTFDFISLGIQPRFSIINKDQLNVFAQGGLNLNYLIHYCQAIDMEFHYHDQMMMKNNIEVYSMDKLNKFSLAASLGLGLEYNFGEHIFSSFTLGTNRSLNSIKQLSSNADHTRTYIDNLGVSLTAGYRF